jgi:putative membrane protein
VGAVALLHVYFLVLEMFLWDKPFGLRTFGMTAAKAEVTRSLAIKGFFLACVLVAGIFGAATASRKILWVQAVPAAVALGLLYLA